jgi:hypothetical protein
MTLESDGGMILTAENRRARRKTCPSATLSTTNPTRIDLGANPGLRGERPATNDLSHGTAIGRSYSQRQRFWPLNCLNWNLGASHLLEVRWMGGKGRERRGQY